ncbi:prephenate dehydratase [Micromonospora costi]|uniref:prephenate dehydratase n=1 Tax=Micromonospora costi TaxID=1530042 RepID=UPI0033D1F002
MPGTPPTRFVYLGPEGTFAEQALRTLPAAERGARTPARSVGEALESVRAGDADAALVPLENSIGGAVGVTLDELAEGEPLVITREVILPVEFVLGARPGTDPSTVRTVAAHPQASTQCRNWLRTHLPDATVVDVLSNGAAAAGAAAGEYDAAICAPIGATRHRLAVLADKIADHPDAVTRFALLSRPGPPPPPTGDDVTSLAVYIAHDRVGALLSVLMELAVRGVNLSRIESRPTGEALGRYVFFLDCTGHVADVRLGEALQGLRRVCADVRFLGSYPRHRWTEAAGDRPVPPPPGLSDVDYADAAAWLARLRAGELS